MCKNTDIINTDVLIVGGGIVGAIHAYVLNEKKIKTTILNKGNNESTLKTSLTKYQIGQGFKKISSLLKKDDIFNDFKFTLEAIYKLDEIINNLDDNCEYIRKPIFYYTNKDGKYNYIFSGNKIEKRNSQNSDNDKNNYSINKGLLSYNCGATVNLVKLENELYKYCDRNKINIFDNVEVKDISSDDKNVFVKTNNYKIKCKKIITVIEDDLLSGLQGAMYLSTKKNYIL